jgi:hypothetical protein
MTIHPLQAGEGRTYRRGHCSGHATPSSRFHMDLVSFSVPASVGIPNGTSMPLPFPTAGRCPVCAPTPCGSGHPLTHIAFIRAAEKLQGASVHALAAASAVAAHLLPTGPAHHAGPVCVASAYRVAGSSAGWPGADATQTALSCLARRNGSRFTGTNTGRAQPRQTRPWGRPARHAGTGSTPIQGSTSEYEGARWATNGHAANRGRRRSAEIASNTPSRIHRSGWRAIAILHGKARNVNRQSQEVLFLELAEEVEDGMKRAHELVKRLDIYCLERKAIRQMERNGIDSWRAKHTLRELDAERKRLVSEN